LPTPTKTEALDSVIKDLSTGRTKQVRYDSYPDSAKDAEDDAHLSCGSDLVGVLAEVPTERSDRMIEC
jgi:hypothetical protein